MQEQLSKFVLAELFGKSLVIADDVTRPQEEQIPKKKADSRFLGGYEKKIVIGVNDAANLHVDDETLQFLTGILIACKLNLSHVAVVNFHQHSLNYQEIKKQMQPQFILLFGVTPVQIELPFIMPDYKVQSFDNCLFLTAPALQALNKESEESKKEKIKLWSGLKKMFELK